MTPMSLVSTERLRIALFAYGFRPFFLLAGLWAIVPMIVVIWAIFSGGWPEQAVPLFTWHGHEMVFGFVAAAIAGFLLTAVPSWTGTKAVSGLPLIALVALWLIGRVESSPFWEPTGFLGQALAVAFFPVLACVLVVPIVASRNFRNLPFLLFLGLLFSAEWVYHAAQFGWLDTLPFDPLRLAVNTVLLLVVIIGGRIVPAFSRNAFVARGRDARVRASRLLDAAAIAATVAVLVGDIVARGTVLAGSLAGMAAALLTLRLIGWRGWRALDMPLVWVLHLGYAWVIAGLALKAAWLLGGHGWAMNWMHAITLGAFGTMILGVTTRAALGHTGRPLEASTPIAAAYLMISVAALLRIWALWFLPNQYSIILALTSVAWVSAFATFLLIYAPILARPRIDGRPG